MDRNRNVLLDSAAMSVGNIDCIGELKALARLEIIEQPAAGVEGPVDRSGARQAVDRNAGTGSEQGEQRGGVRHCGIDPTPRCSDRHIGDGQDIADVGIRHIK